MKMDPKRGIIVPTRTPPKKEEAVPNTGKEKWSDRFASGEYFIIKGVIFQLPKAEEGRLVLKPLLLNPGTKVEVTVPKGFPAEPPGSSKAPGTGPLKKIKGGK